MYNLILDVDSYKASHFNQYPPATEYLSSYIEARGGKFSHNVFFGLQRFVKRYLQTPITRENIVEAEQLLQEHGLPFNREGWEYILEKYHGYLPLEIKALPEGTLVPVRNVMVQVTNTDPICAWLVGYIETALLRAIWYPTTVATVSFAIKQIIFKYLAQTSDATGAELANLLAFKLHDFGARGASSSETSAIGGLAHLVNFKGTDSLQALVEACDCYAEPMAGFSIPAAEHSTITSWGKDHEAEAYAQVIDNYLVKGDTVSLVCDSYDLINALENILGKEPFLSKIKNSKGTLVIRPDSGEPKEIVLQTMQILERIFGCETNGKGYKVLPPYIRVIQGDGVNINSISEICAVLEANGYSIENVAFGMGAELQQKVNRDTSKFAMKVSAIYMDGGWHDAFKQPITDPGKVSKKGLLKSVVVDGQMLTIRADDEQYQHLQDELAVVYRNGELIVEADFEQVRKRANSYLEVDFKVEGK